MINMNLVDYICSRMTSFKNFLFLFLFVFSINIAAAEIIDNQKVVNKEFGSWVVSCKEDMMLGETNCKLFTDILDGSTLFINPNNKENKVAVISREALDGSKIIFRVDKDNLIESEVIKNNRYDVVDISIDNKKQLLESLKTGSFLYVRMNVKDSSSKSGSKQVTARFNLADFSKALIYYNSMAKAL